MNSRAVLTLIVLAGAGQAVFAQTTFYRKGLAELSGRIEVFDTAGTVTVSAWDRPEFSVDARLDPGVDRVEVTSAKGVNTIRVILKDDVELPKNAYLNVNAPAGSVVDVRTISATISVHGTSGPLRLTSVSGSTHVDGFGKDLTIKSESGRVDIKGSGGASVVQVGTDSGAISIRDASGSFAAETNSGRVELALMKVSAARVRTDSGSVAIAAQPASETGGKFDIRTTSGRVSLSLANVPESPARARSTPIAGPLNANTRVEVSTVSGSVGIIVSADRGFRYDLSSNSGPLHTCFEDGVYGTKQLVGQRRDGTAQIQVRTVSGSVEVCDRPKWP